MSDKPEKIWLIGVDSDEYVWCDDPAPSPGMEERDAVEYIRADLVKPSEQPKMDIVELTKYAEEMGLKVKFEV